MARRATAVATIGQQEFASKAESLEEKTFLARVSGRGERECRGVDALDAVGNLAAVLERGDDWEYIDVQIDGRTFTVHLPPKNHGRDGRGG
jgi:hypothetical protein